MKEMKLTLKVITPMFMHGADGRTAEFRIPELKAALRFWWRASHYEQDHKELYANESKVFGGVNPATKSNLVMRAIGNVNIANFNRMPVGQKRGNMIEVGTTHGVFQINILDYLAYGEHERINRQLTYTKQPIQPTDLTLSVTVADERYADVETAFGLLSNYGCLGGKSRNGFGSVQVFDDNQNEIQATLQGCNGNDLPVYTAGSNLVKRWKTRGTHESWDAALAEIGKIYRDARLQLETRHDVSRRSFVALPVNISGQRGNFTGSSQNSNIRRAKPYFLKVRKENERFVGYITFIPAVYYLEKGPQGWTGRWTKEARAVWKTMNDYFNGHLTTVNEGGR